MRYATSFRTTAIAILLAFASFSAPNARVGANNETEPLYTVGWYPEEWVDGVRYSCPIGTVQYFGTTFADCGEPVAQIRARFEAGEWLEYDYLTPERDHAAYAASVTNNFVYKGHSINNGGPGCRIKYWFGRPFEFVPICEVIPQEPSSAPSSAPTGRPTVAPTAVPTTSPSTAPSAVPTTSSHPSTYPSASPTISPSDSPTASPTNVASSSSLPASRATTIIPDGLFLIFVMIFASALELVQNFENRRTQPSPSGGGSVNENEEKYNDTFEEEKEEEGQVDSPDKEESGNEEISIGNIRIGTVESFSRVLKASDLVDGKAKQSWNSDVSIGVDTTTSIGAGKCC